MLEKPIQKRSQKTRDRMIAAARSIVQLHGYDALRTEDVVKHAKVAKGTFFAHFDDKDTLLDLLIGTELLLQLDKAATQPVPNSVNEIMERLQPVTDIMTQSRTVFDVIMRHSGATAIETIGPIAQSFEKMILVATPWFIPARNHPFRKDIDPVLLAEGVQAFYLQAIGITFCAVNGQKPFEERLSQYLNAWLMPLK